MRRVASFGFVLVIVLASPGWAGRVGVTKLSLIKPSLTTGQPRALDPTVWYPAAAKRTASPYVNAVPDAPVRRGKFPMIVFSHGSCGRPTEATYYTTELAKRGFIVVAPTHPGNTADDGLAVCASTDSFVDSAINRVPDVKATIDAM